MSEKGNKGKIQAGVFKYIFLVKEIYFSFSQMKYKMEKKKKSSK